jgi:Domain of unknown function (DUF4132)
VVPDCGFDVHGSRVFDFGARRFHLLLAPGLTPQVRDAVGRIHEKLPAPTGSDDPGKRSGWRLLTRTLREVLKVQAARLEDVMSCGRRWTPMELQKLIVMHPRRRSTVRPGHGSAAARPQ